MTRIEQQKESPYLNILNFLSSHKRYTARLYTKSIIEKLNTGKLEAKNQGEKQNEGWIRLRSLYKDLVESKEIPNQTTFYRLLKDLETDHVIIKSEDNDYRGKGKKPTIYKVPVMYPESIFNYDSKDNAIIARLYEDLEMAKTQQKEQP